MDQMIKEFIEKNNILDGVQTVVLAVSGGADSMALAHFMATNFPAYRYTVAHLNHGLRQAAAAEEALVRDFSASRRLPFCAKRADIAAIARERKQGIEETGREERYRFFRELNADLILTAHHKNDVAETVLLHLIRGSGLKGVTGIAPKENGVGRPLLCVGKAELLSYCAVHGIAYAEDETNGDTSYTRNKIRHELLPLMAAINPDVVDALYRFSIIASGDEAVLAAAADKFLDFFGESNGTTFSLGRDDLHGLAPPLAKRVIRTASASLGKEIDYETTAKIMALCPGKKLPLTTALWVRLEDGCYRFEGDRERLEKAVKVALPLTGKIEIPAINVTVETYLSAEECRGDINDVGIFPLELLNDGCLTVRTRENGDKILLPDGKTKKLSDYFIDEKIPASSRDQIILIAVGKRVLWIVGRRFFASPGKNNIVVRLQRQNYSNN